MKGFKADLSAGELLEMYADTVYRLAFSRTGNKADSEDITQEVFFKYIQADKRFRDEEHRKAWILRVTVNCINSFVTSAYNRHRADIEDADNVSADEPQAESLDFALKELDEKYRVVIHLFYYENMSIEQISKVTDTKVSTIKSRLKRGRERLKVILEEASYGYQ